MGIVVEKTLFFFICSLFVLPVWGQYFKDSLSGESRGIRVMNTPEGVPYERPMVVQLMAPPEMMGIQFRTRLYWFLGAAGVSFDKTRYPQQDSTSFSTAFDARSVCIKAVAMPFVNRDEPGLHYHGLSLLTEIDF